MTLESHAFFTSVAMRLFARRGWRFAASFLAIAMLLGTFSLASADLAFVAAMLVEPAMAVPWALLCACIGLHPQRGRLQPQNNWLGGCRRFFKQGCAGMRPQFPGSS